MISFVTFAPDYPRRRRLHSRENLFLVKISPISVNFSKKPRFRSLSLVVADGKVYGVYEKLSDAKRQILTYTKAQKVPVRFTLEVENRKVVRNVFVVGRQNQKDGLQLFNQWWRNLRQVTPWYQKAQDWYDRRNRPPKLSKSPSPRPSKSASPKPSITPSPICQDARGTFLVCIRSQVVKKYSSLCDAQKRLNK